MPQIGWLEILAVVIIAILVLGQKSFNCFKRLEIILIKQKLSIKCSKRNFIRNRKRRE